jgi:hypothetical protein
MALKTDVSVAVSVFIIRELPSTDPNMFHQFPGYEDRYGYRNVGFFTAI